MTLFDRFINIDTKIEVRLEIAKCLRRFFQGEPAPKEMADGIYVGYEGWVVIDAGIVASVTNDIEYIKSWIRYRSAPPLKIYSKWGKEIKLEDDIAGEDPMIDLRATD